MHSVVIIGHPNVGKSTLFNRLIGARQAIVENVPGVTRDRIYGVCSWSGREFSVIDTGGFVPHDQDVLVRAIREQVEIAMEQAALILFMVDVTAGITAMDDTIASLLRRSQKPVILIVNKVDNFKRSVEAAEFYKLGFGELFMVSAISGSGTGELLDRVIALLPEEALLSDQEELPRFAVVGQPNTGKSTFINALMGEPRNIVSEVAGTTRDSIHSVYDKFGKKFMLIDTAGLRRKANVTENLEFYATMRAVKAIDESDVCLLLIDALQGISAQDLNIFRLAERRSKGIVILVNKWDLVEKETKTAREFEMAIRERLEPFSDVPIVFMSARDKQRIHKAIEAALEVYQNRRRRVPTAQLNQWLEESLNRQQPPAYRGSHIKIKYATQLPMATPVIALFCNHPDHVREGYRQYLMNRLRETFPFTGVPVKLVFRKK